MPTRYEIRKTKTEISEEVEAQKAFIHSQVEQGEKVRYILIVTGYNCLEHAKKCVTSIQRIKFHGNWMAVLCSDGSTDGTTQFIEKVAQQDGRFKCQFTTENMGAAFQRH